MHLLDGLNASERSSLYDILGDARYQLGNAVTVGHDTRDAGQAVVEGGVVIIAIYTLIIIHIQLTASIRDNPFTVARIGIGDIHVRHLD